MYLMKLPEDGPKYGLKHGAVIKLNQCKELGWFILKYLCCQPEYHKS
jgi:hypothetical protein